MEKLKGNLDSIEDCIVDDAGGELDHKLQLLAINYICEQKNKGN